MASFILKAATAALVLSSGASAKRFDLRFYANTTIATTNTNTATSSPSVVLPTSLTSTVAAVTSHGPTYLFTNTSTPIASTAIVSTPIIITTATATQTQQAGQSTTSTVFATLTRTITDCPPVVTNCPAHGTKTVTETIPIYTTVCPVATTTATNKVTLTTTFVSTHLPPGATQTITETITATYCPGDDYSVPAVPVTGTTTATLTVTVPKPTHNVETPYYPTDVPAVDDNSVPAVHTPVAPSVVPVPPQAPEQATSAALPVQPIAAVPTGFNTTTIPQPPAASAPASPSPVAAGADKVGVSALGAVGILAVFML